MTAPKAQLAKDLGADIVIDARTKAPRRPCRRTALDAGLAAAVAGTSRGLTAAAGTRDACGSTQPTDQAAYERAGYVRAMRDVNCAATRGDQAAV
jgi:hypothetical protein